MNKSGNRYKFYKRKRRYWTELRQLLIDRLKFLKNFRDFMVENSDSNIDIFGN